MLHVYSSDAWPGECQTDIEQIFLLCYYKNFFSICHLIVYQLSPLSVYQFPPRPNIGKYTLEYYREILLNGKIEAWNFNKTIPWIFKQIITNKINQNTIIYSFLVGFKSLLE